MYSSWNPRGSKPSGSSSSGTWMHRWSSTEDKAMEGNTAFTADMACLKEKPIEVVSRTKERSISLSSTSFERS